jgi:hypothetical protein
MTNGPEGWCMAKAKKTKPRGDIPVSLITKNPAKFIDFAYAPDAATAPSAMRTRSHTRFFPKPCRMPTKERKPFATSCLCGRTQRWLA